MLFVRNTCNTYLGCDMEMFFLALFFNRIVLWKIENLKTESRLRLAPKMVASQFLFVYYFTTTSLFTFLSLSCLAEKKAQKHGTISLLALAGPSESYCMERTNERTNIC